MMDEIGRPRILLVDDEPAWLNEAAAFLRTQELAVETAAGAGAARTLLTSGLGFWVCVLDLHLGEANAIDLLQAIFSLRLPTETQFILISGAADVRSVTQGFRHGICDFLEKPIAAGQLLSAVQHATALFEQRAIARSATRFSQGALIRHESAPAAERKRGDRETVRAVAWLGRLRDKHFPVKLNEPEWRMIIDACEAEMDGLACNVTSICLASGEPYATAYRYLNRLIAEGLLVKRGSRTDARAMEIEPSATCRSCLAELIAAAKERVAP